MLCQGEGEGGGEPMPQHNSRAGSSGVGVASKLEKRKRERWERRHAPPTKIGRLILQRRIYRRENGGARGDDPRDICLCGQNKAHPLSLSLSPRTRVQSEREESPRGVLFWIYEEEEHEHACQLRS